VFYRPGISGSDTHSPQKFRGSTLLIGSLDLLQDCLKLLWSPASFSRPMLLNLACYLGLPYYLRRLNIARLLIYQNYCGIASDLNVSSPTAVPPSTFASGDSIRISEGPEPRKALDSTFCGKL